MIAEWMDRLVEFAADWFWLVLLAAWKALPILVIVSGIGLALRRRLSPALYALLLTLILVRLLLPISLSSPMSLQRPLMGWFSTESADTPVRLPQSYLQMRSYLPNVDRIDELQEWTPSETQSFASSLPLAEVFWVITWLVVVSVTMGLILRSAVAHVRFAFRLRSCRLLDDQQIIDWLLRECDQLRVGRRPALCEVPSLTAPAVFGLFRQTICLPPGLTQTLTEQELRWVFRHELAHIRRRDIPVAILASLATAFHWFNPFVWMIVSRLRAAMESAADRLAVQSLSQSDVTAYGELLIRFAENSMTPKRLPTLGLLSFASGKHLKHRVELLMRHQKPKGWTSKIFPTVLAMAIALVGLTDAKEVREQSMPELHLISGESNSLNLQPQWLNPLGVQVSKSSDPVLIKTYDVTAILAAIPTSLKNGQKTPLAQLIALSCIPSSMQEKMQLTGKTLSAKLTANQHQILKQILDDWQNGEPTQIAIETRIMQTNTRIASSIDWTGRRIDGLSVQGLGPAIAARIDESELAQLVREVTDDRTSNMLFAPKVTLFDGQKGSITDQVNRPFVTGVDPKTDGSMRPIVSIVGEGLAFILEPNAENDGSTTLAFEVRSSSIGKVSYANLPIKALENSKSQVTVQVPAMEQYSVSSTVKLSARESVIVAIPRVFDNKPGADADTTVIVALTPRILDLEKQFVEVESKPAN